MTGESVNDDEVHVLPVRRYTGMIWLDDQPGMRFHVESRSLAEAREQVVAEYGEALSRSEMRTTRGSPGDIGSRAAHWPCEVKPEGNGRFPSDGVCVKGGGVRGGMGQRQGCRQLRAGRADRRGCLHGPASIGLPVAPGRVWREADIGLSNSMSRAKQPGTRLLYPDDGLAFVTPNHYERLYQLPGWW
jgi:hypothetical protein